MTMVREYRARVDVIRNGATVTSLHPVNDPTVDCNSDAEIKMSMAGQFLADPLVNWLTDELKLYQIINDVEYPVGVFPIGTTSEDTDENGARIVSVEGYDRALILKQTKTESILHIPAGKNYMQAIEELLVQAGIATYISIPTSQTLATDREDWAVGTSYLTVINTLLSEINYNSIWFNQDGFAMLQPAKKPSASNIDHQYGVLDKIKILQRSCSVERDVYDAPNVFIAICSNPDLDAPLIATAVNDNPLSSLSTFKRGRRIVRVNKVANIPSQDALQEYIQQICLESMLASEYVTIYTANLPGHGVFDTVAIDHSDVSGIFQEASWHLTLAPGQTMTHKLRRAVLV